MPVERSPPPVHASAGASVRVRQETVGIGQTTNTTNHNGELNGMTGGRSGLEMTGSSKGDLETVGNRQVKGDKLLVGANKSGGQPEETHAPFKTPGQTPLVNPSVEMINLCDEEEVKQKGAKKRKLSPPVSGMPQNQGFQKKALLITLTLTLKKISRITSRCGCAGCLTCPILEERNCIISATTRERFPITTWMTCSSSHLVYVIRCVVCGKQYVGETIKALHLRITNHRTAFRATVDSPLTDTSYTGTSIATEVLHRLELRLSLHFPPIFSHSLCVTLPTVREG